MASFSQPLNELRVVITGAVRSMGHATAAMFASEGPRVAVTDFELTGAKAVTKEIEQAGFSARTWIIDVSDGDEIKE